MRATKLTGIGGFKGPMAGIDTGLCSWLGESTASLFQGRPKTACPGVASWLFRVSTDCFLFLFAFLGIYRGFGD